MDQIGKREIKDLNSKLEPLGAKISKKANVSVQDNFYFIENELSFFTFHDHVLPSLKTIYADENIKKKMKKVTCDMGAVKFVVKGADLMRPGVISFDETIKKDEPVIIVDESHGKPIAVGISLFSADDYQEKETGKSIKNLHYVGDAIWKGDVPA
ncbi:MAG: DUF1947 domain-containing protein [Candidatus Woesearchaeota archaeon]